MKTCTMCKEDKKLSLFHKNKSKKDGYGNICKNCRKKYHSKWYLNGKKDYVINKNKNTRIKKRQWLWDYLLNHPCNDCGENNPIVLEFDHQRDKKFNISQGIHRYAFKKVKEEIEKCEVVCANCHRIRTSKSHNWFNPSKH